MPRSDLRFARHEDQAPIDDLILRSKAYWGYDAGMMAIMAQVLKVCPDAIADQRVKIALVGEQIAGVAQIRQTDPLRVELELLFIDPAFMGQGIGQKLYGWAIDQALHLNCEELVILSDPYAQPFYEKLGARLVEMRPSDAVPGRELPWMIHPLTGQIRTPREDSGQS